MFPTHLRRDLQSLECVTIEMCSGGGGDRSPRQASRLTLSVVGPPGSLPTTSNIEKPTNRTSHYKVAAAWNSRSGEPEPSLPSFFLKMKAWLFTSVLMLVHARRPWDGALKADQPAPRKSLKHQRPQGCRQEALGPQTAQRCHGSHRYLLPGSGDRAECGRFASLGDKPEKLPQFCQDETSAQQDG